MVAYKTLTADNLAIKQLLSNLLASLSKGQK